jgi:hypothetical protein
VDRLQDLSTNYTVIHPFSLESRDLLRAGKMLASEVTKGSIIITSHKDWPLGAEEACNY